MKDQPFYLGYRSGDGYRMSIEEMYNKGNGRAAKVEG